MPVDYMPHSKAALNTSPCKRPTLDLQCIDSAPSNTSLHVPGTVAPGITDAVPWEDSARLQIIDKKIGISFVNTTALMYPTVSICHNAAVASADTAARICKASKQQDVQDSGLS